MRAGASRAIESARGPSTIPAPAMIVSRACASGVSPSVTAAAMPPWAQTLDAPAPSGAPVSRVTVRGASLSAQNKPASPPPAMTMLFEGTRVDMRRFRLCIMPGLAGASPNGAGLAFEMNHPLHRPSRFLSDQWIEHDLVLHGEQTVENLWQRDPLHVRAQIARLHELDIRHFDPHVVGHRAFGHHHDSARPFGPNEVDHMCGRAGEVGLGQHVG